MYMKSSRMAMAVLLCSAAAVMAQERPTEGAKVSALVGLWDGMWLSNGRQQARGKMEIRIDAIEGARPKGAVRFVTSATPPCSQEWQPFTATNEGEKFSARLDVDAAARWLSPSGLILREVQLSEGIRASTRTAVTSVSPNNSAHADQFISPLAD